MDSARLSLRLAVRHLAIWYRLLSARDSARCWRRDGTGERADAKDLSVSRAQLVASDQVLVCTLQSVVREGRRSSS